MGVPGSNSSVEFVYDNYIKNNTKEKGGESEFAIMIFLSWGIEEKIVVIEFQWKEEWKWMRNGDGGEWSIYMGGLSQKSSYIENWGLDDWDWTTICIVVIYAVQIQSWGLERHIRLVIAMWLMWE